MCDYFSFHCHAGRCDLIGGTVVMDGDRTLLYGEAPP